MYTTGWKQSNSRNCYKLTIRKRNGLSVLYDVFSGLSHATVSNACSLCFTILKDKSHPSTEHEGQRGTRVIELLFL